VHCGNHHSIAEVLAIYSGTGPLEYCHAILLVATSGGTENITKLNRWHNESVDASRRRGSRFCFWPTAFTPTAPCGAVLQTPSSQRKRARGPSTAETGHAGNILQSVGRRLRRPSPKIGRPVALRDSSTPNSRASRPLTPRQATDGKRSTKQQIPAPRPPGRPLQPQVEILPPGTPTASPAPRRGFLPDGRRPTALPYDINYGAASSVTIAAKPSPAMPTVPNLTR